MKIALIQIDGKLPNLALMKLSAWHKKRGDEVYLMKGKTISKRLIEFDKIYVSCIFEENKQIAIQVSEQFKNSEIGGIGFGYNKIPNEIEHLMPDYNLYKIDYSMGFTSRGCIRNCEFCEVPKNEGKIKHNAMIKEFHYPEHKKIVLLDNNFLVSPKFKENIKYLIDNDLKVSYNQGLDIRIINKRNAKLIAQTKYYDLHFKERRIYFSWDTLEIEKEVLKGIHILEDVGVKPHNLMFYVLCGFNTTEKQDYYRIKKLIDLDTKPFVMKYNGRTDSEFLNKLAKWINRRYYKVTEFDEYNYKKKSGEITKNSLQEFFPKKENVIIANSDKIQKDFTPDSSSRSFATQKEVS